VAAQWLAGGIVRIELCLAAIERIEVGHEGALPRFKFPGKSPLFLQERNDCPRALYFFFAKLYAYSCRFLDSGTLFAGQWPSEPLLSAPNCERKFIVPWWPLFHSGSISGLLWPDCLALSAG
jgi:hypothetical protein